MLTQFSVRSQLPAFLPVAQHVLSS